MVSNKKLASAVGGKTARACDSCLRKRARWYCAADDAFLCQACDGSVHSANPLARRHERVRLKTSCFKSSDEGHDSQSPMENSEPSWHHGFTRKARTPRHGKQSAYHHRRQQQQPKSEDLTQNSHPLVPELGAGETYSNEENEEQLLYRVPVFDPFVSELCSSGKSNEFANNSLRGFLPNSETEIEEFAADVESLLGKGLDEESFDMEALGLLDCKEKESVLGVKVEEEGDTGGVQLATNHVDDQEMDVSRELSFEFNFDYESPATCDEEGEDEVVRKMKNRKFLLRLDYEAVTRAWANQRSPWTTGDRPELNPSDCWPDCMGSFGTVHNPCVGVKGGQSAMVDSGREARVSRYREKRRTRLFSKKIRYEVRKLNAEKRPRMKGRFVKRANFAGPSFPLLGK